MSNSIAISRFLVGAGIERKSADAIAEKIVDHSTEHLVTKVDSEKSKADVKEEIVKLRTEMKEEFAESKEETAELRTEMKEGFGKVKEEFGKVRNENAEQRMMIKIMLVVICGVAIRLIFDMLQ